jgi:hypothetical protein
MLTLRGRVANIHTQGGETHVTTFTINDSTIQVTDAFPPVIYDGDEVSVMGPRKNGILLAYAYRNHSKRAQGSLRGKSAMIFSAVFVFFTLTFVPIFWMDPFWKFVLIVMLGGGIWMFSLGVRAWLAERALFSAT